MKTILILTAGLFLSFGLTAQITVSDYEIKTSCDVNKIQDFKPVTATSTCGEVQVEMKEMMFSGGCLGTLTRTYIFTDDCGNTGKAEQYILLKDNDPPIFHGVPVDATVSDLKDVPKVAKVTATDNIGDDEVEIEYNEIKKDNTIRRVWAATDTCGNSVRAQQIITVENL